MLVNGIKCWIEDAASKDLYDEYLVNVEGPIGRAFIAGDQGIPFAIAFSYPETIEHVYFRIQIGRIVVRYPALKEDRKGYFRVLGLRKSTASFAPFMFGLKEIAGKGSLAKAIAKDRLR
jgi:hypothetical protein